MHIDKYYYSKPLFGTIIVVSLQADYNRYTHWG